MKNFVLALILSGNAILIVPTALAAGAQKGVIYLPVVSLSGYLPIAVQILLMILVIALSGMFGAWLMFQRLAKKVLALETQQAAVTQGHAQKTAKVTGAVAVTPLLATVTKTDDVPQHRRQLFVSKNAKPNDDDTRVVPQTFLVNDWFPLKD